MMERRKEWQKMWKVMEEMMNRRLNNLLLRESWQASLEEKSTKKLKNNLNVSEMNQNSRPRLVIISRLLLVKNNKIL